jgi:uncharacterized protein
MSVLIIDLEDIKSGSFSTSGEVRPEELNLESLSLLTFSGPLSLDIRLNTPDQLTFHLTGTLSYVADGECRRCLKDVKQPVEHKLRGMFAFPSALDKLEMNDDERRGEGVFPLDAGAGEIDLTGLVRESLVLEYPRFLECDSRCRGLCPSCGTNLNFGDCDCREDSIDPRWSKLLELKDRK